MALLRHGDRVREATDTEGAADYHLNGVIDPLEASFKDSNIGDQGWCYYCCESIDGWEIGYGQVLADPGGQGFDILTRDTIHGSSNNGLKVPWGAGSKTIYNTATAKSLDHIAGFVVNNSDISFNRQKFIAIASQVNFDFIYIRGSLEVRKDGLVLTEDQYSATDGETFTLNTPCTVGQVVEAMAIGQYTTTHTELSTPVPTGQLFKSGMFFNSVWRNESAALDAVGTDCVRVNNPTTVDGDKVYLDGVTSTINLTDLGLNHSAPFTISFWAETASTLTDSTLIANQSVSDLDGYLHVRTTAAGQLVVAVLSDSDVEQTASIAIAVDTLYSFIIRYDGTDLILTQDNVVGTPVTVAIKTTTATNDFTIGSRLYPTISDFCEISIYGINIYDTLLSDTEIADIYSEPDAPDVTTLEAVVIPGGAVATQGDIIAMVIALA